MLTGPVVGSSTPMGAAETYSSGKNGHRELDDDDPPQPARHIGHMSTGGDDAAVGVIKCIRYNDGAGAGDDGHPSVGESNTSTGGPAAVGSTRKRLRDLEGDSSPPPARRPRFRPVGSDVAARGAIKRTHDQDETRVEEEDHPSKRLKAELMLLEELKPTPSWWKRFVELFNPG